MESSSSAPARDPFSAALEALRRKLADGRLVLGEPLKIADVARELDLSATPVREALSRLAGEGLIEDRRGRGYAVQKLDSIDLTELYGLRCLFLQRALEIVPAPLSAQAGDGASGAGLGASLSAVLEQLIERTGDRTLSEAYRRTANRLAPATRIETKLFPAPSDSDRILESSEVETLRRVIVDIHDVRRFKAADLVRLIRANIGRP